MRYNISTSEMQRAYRKAGGPLALTNVALTDGQLDVIVAALEVYVEGFEDATTDVINDRSHPTPEQLCDAVAGMHDDFASAVSALGILRLAQREAVR